MTRLKCLQNGLIICLIGMWGCGGAPDGTVVAQVGESHLTKESLADRIPEPFIGKISIEEKQNLVENWVEEELLYQEALKQNLDEDPTLASRIEKAVRQFLVAELMSRTHARDDDVLEGEVLDYYKEHRPDFERDQPEFWVRHIVVKDKNTLNQVWERLQKGEFFEQVAREASIDPSAQQGGDLGYFSADMVDDAAFWTACEETKVGRRVRTSTQMGHHIIEVRDRREAGSMRDLVDVRGKINQRILAERRQEQRDKLLGEIKERIQWSMALDKLE